MADAGGAPVTRQQLLDQHAQLATHVGDLRQVDQLLRASLALNESSAVAPLLRQRIQLCGAAITLLGAPLAVTAGREAEEGKVLAQISAFVEESVVMLREQKVRGRGRGGRRSAPAAALVLACALVCPTGT